MKKRRLKIVKVKTIPPLKCPVPECGSTKVHKNSAGSIICEDCHTKTTKFGNQREDDNESEWLRRFRHDDRAWLEKSTLKNT